MKNKNYRLLSLLFVIPLILTGCGGGSAEPTPGPGPQPSEPAVTSVVIAEPDETTVLDGTRVSLKASVKGEEGVSQKVTWTTSNEQVATVTNGVVNFLKVAQETKVTITATSNADKEKKDSVEFTVEHSPFDIKNSRGDPDTSLYLDEGSFIVDEPQDVALIYADVHDTRWYVEATIQINEFDPNDEWPKFGIMASEREDGFWVHEKSHQCFYYVDTHATVQTWTAMNVVTENQDLTDWYWGGQIGSAVASPAVKLGQAFKMGLMRDGNKFYQFYGKATDVTLACVGSFEYNSFGADPNYVWVGGWKTAVVVSDPKCMVGDAINELYSVPEGLALKSEEEVLYIGETYRIQVTTEGAWDRNKLTFTSSDPTIAAVDENGVVTASLENTGEVTIAVGLEGTELSAEFKVTVTDDRMFSVVLDGEMNDAIWTEAVKANFYLLKKHDNCYIKIYGSKNSKGVYLFLDYTTDVPKTEGGGWWMWDNCEFRLADDSKAWSGQYWLSAENGGSFVSCGSQAAGYTEKAEAIFYKALALGEDELYHGAFEAFIPYGDDEVTKGEPTYACFGFNPTTGWVQGYNWYANPIDENTLQITANGFAHDGTQCHAEEGAAHLYGALVVDQAATCAAEGSAHKICKVCGHREEVTLEIDPNSHRFDYENAVASEHPTCSTNGTAVCLDCGAEDYVVLPDGPAFDYTNHSDAAYVAGEHSYCHHCGVGSHLANQNGDAVDHAFGGWDNKATWYDMGVWSGDFKVTFEFNMRGCQGVAADAAPADTCWRTVLPVIYDEGYSHTDHKVDAVFRMDWFGWTDGGFTSAQNNGVCPDGFDWAINYQGYSNMDVVLVVTKVGAAVTLDWTWHILAEGAMNDRVFEYHQGCTLVNADKAGVALSGEWVNMTVTRAEFSRVLD